MVNKFLALDKNYKFMLKSLIPQNLRTNGFLYFSAILTWALVSFIYLKRSEINLQFIWQASALISFILLFFYNISTKKSLLPFSLTVLLEISLLLILIYFDNYQIIPILFALVATQLPAHFNRRQAIFILLLINIAYYFTLIADHPNQSIYTVLIFFVLQVFAFSVIEATLKEQKAKEEISAINQELLATRFMLKESSKKQERLRISRDLHDVLGHQLTALALNLEVTNHKVNDEFKVLTEQNLQQAKQLLQGVRNVVKEMRNEDQFDSIAHLNTLFQQLPNCQLTIKNTVMINSLSLNQQLIFCLQEGVSNALRHGKANNFELDLHKDNHIISIKLSDNGIGCQQLITGNGITGMKERLADYSGEVELTSTNKGCTLTIKVEDTYD